MPCIVLFGKSICVALVLAMISGAAHASGGVDCNNLREQPISMRVHKIQTEKDITVRIPQAQELSYYVLSIAPETVCPSEVSALTDLLGDKEDGVRNWAANSLAHLGKRARSATSALRSAYKLSACDTREATSAPAIELALENMGEKIPRIQCPSLKPVKVGHH